MPELGKLLTAREVCALFRITEKTLGTWIKTSVVPVVRLGRRARRFREADIRKIVEGGTK